MALSVRALCLIDETNGLKGELGITGNAEDTRLERLVETATRSILHWCGRPEGFHHEAARAEDIKGYGTPILQAFKKIIAITSIVYDPHDTAETVDSSLYFVDDADEGRIYRRGGWQWAVAHGRAILRHPLPGTEERIYRVTYECGFKTRNQIDNLSVAGTMDLPEDIEDACLMLAAMRHRWRPRNPGVKSEKLSKWSASYMNSGSGSGMPAEVELLLEPWRRVVWA